MRKLATIRDIDEIRPIEGADAIEVAVIEGWEIVVKKGEFAPGQAVIYLEIDSWVPTEIAPFLTKNAALPREYNGVKGERLRTIRLRGQISQGLILNYWDFPDVVKAFHKTRLYDPENPHFDVTDILGITKWEAPISAQLQGQARGNFPTDLVPKTDQERIQNYMKYVTKHADDCFEISLKLDGSSCTMFRWEDIVRACSRNLELKLTEENADNTFVKLALEFGPRIPEGYAFQGEVMGPGVQGNRENLKDHKFFVFDIYDINKKKHVDPVSRRLMCQVDGFDHVPILDDAGKAPTSVAEALAFVDGLKSINHPIAEGAVWKSNNDPSFSFKAISNKFLLKEKD